MLDIKSGKCGFSNTSWGGWSTSANKVVMMYTSYCDIRKHTDKNGSDCSNYTESLYHMPQFEGTCAHEFGHVIGLYDLYPSAVDNNDYYIKSNNEVYYSSENFGLPAAGCIMYHNSCSTENDIEIILNHHLYTNSTRITSIILRSTQ